MHLNLNQMAADKKNNFSILENNSYVVIFLSFSPIIDGMLVFVSK